jgi:hypothetical protein
MKRFGVGLLALALAGASTGQEVLSKVAAAGRAGKSMVVYFEASYARSLTNPKAHLRIESGKAIVLVAPGTEGEIERLGADCVGSDEMLDSYHASPYGAGAEGQVIALLCPPKMGFLFLLISERQAGQSPSVLSACKDSGMLQTKPVAYAASFGHQAFCMEDWSAVSDPAQRLLTEFTKSRQR